ncbi:Dermonecrotic toxin [compost metagenome]
MLDRYWVNGLADYQACAKLNFIVAANKQISEGSLTEAGKKLAWQFADILPKPSWESLGKATRETPVVQATLLNIYSYVATDIVCLQDNSSGLTLLYIPGNTSPLHEFADEHAMKRWLAEQCKDAAKRKALLQHFPPADIADGLSYSGLETALTGLGLYPKAHHFNSQHPGFATSGVWDPQVYINYKAATYSPVINGDLFLALAQQQKARAYQDATFIINTDSSVTKEKWRGYLSSAINLLAPLALVVPELAPLFALGGVAQFGLGLDQAINGKTLQDKVSGTQDAVYGLLNAAPILNWEVPEKPGIFRVKNDRFVSPSRVNGQLGYPLSPLNPPRLVEQSIVDGMRIPEPIEPLPGGRPEVAGAVIRTPWYNGNPDVLMTAIGDYKDKVLYDLKRDAFITEMDFKNKTEGIYYVASQPPGKGLIRLNDIQRAVTDEDRMSSLKALGIDLKLPVDFAAMESAPGSAIAKQFSSLWVGDKIIAPDLLENIGKNAQLLKNTRYGYRLFLSRTTPSAFAENLRLLQEAAPSVQVIPLEEQPFYDTFSKSEYFAQYEAAIDGNGGVAPNYASASDILRYRLLHHEGGLYMDVDDRLLQPGEYPFNIDGEEWGEPGEKIDEVELKTPPNGLLLQPPLSNEKLGMDCQYNNSMIGSHAGNPTLDAISNEIRLRYQDQQTFYQRRPTLADDPVGFYQYPITLSWLIGPGVLTDVVDRLLPDLRELRQIANLQSCSHTEMGAVLDVDRYQRLRRSHWPLHRIATVGGANTWATT